jgi:hypothetical protein
MLAGVRRWQHHASVPSIVGGGRHVGKALVG